MTGPAPDPAEPEDLLQRARTGDNAALGVLLELYRNYLTLLARLQISRRLQAEFEIDQEHANRSVVALIEELFQQKLVEKVDSDLP